MENGVDHEVEDEASEKTLPEAHRYEVTLERQVIVYATDEETASQRALQVDGVAGRYKVVEVRPVASSGEDERPEIIDNPPKRPT